MGMNIFIIVCWLFAAIINSINFDTRSIIIWLATLVIIIDQLVIINN